MPILTGESLHGPFKGGRRGIHTSSKKLVVEGGGGVSPLPVISWDMMYWVGGDAFQAEGYADTNPIPTWPDEVGVNDLTQTTVDNQPEFIASDANFNNQPTITSLAAATPYPYLDSPDFVDLTQPYTAVMVARVHILPVSGSGYVFFSTHTGPLVQFFTGTTPNEYWIYAGTTLPGGTPDTNTHFFVVTFDGNFSTLEVDGIEVISGNANSGALGSLRLFTNSGASQATATSAAFVGLLNSTLTAQEKADLLSWSQDFYATP